MVPSTPLLPHVCVYSLHLQPLVSSVQWLEWEDSADSEKCSTKVQGQGILARTLTWPCFVFVAPHCLMTYHHLPSFWMAGCIRQTFQQSLSLPLLMEAWMSNPNSDRISRRHSMIKQPNSHFNHYLQKTVYTSITLPTTDGNQVWFTVWLMPPGLTWWLIALVEYATYEELMSPLNSQFLQMKSLRIFQLVTHILKSSWQVVPLHHLTVLVLPLPLLVKQTLHLLQFLLLCVDPLGELKLHRDWTYACVHCLVVFLY